MASAFAAHKRTDDRAILPSVFSAAIKTRRINTAAGKAISAIHSLSGPLSLASENYCPTVLCDSAAPVRLEPPSKTLIDLFDFAAPHDQKQCVVSPKAASFSTEGRSLRQENGFFFQRLIVLTPFVSGGNTCQLLSLSPTILLFFHSYFSENKKNGSTTAPTTSTIFFISHAL